MNTIPDERVIQSYVWHKGRCFFVSTITRDSSAVLDPGRYNETLVWNYDWEKRERGPMMYQRSCSRHSIEQHLQALRELFRSGELKPEE